MLEIPLRKIFGDFVIYIVCRVEYIFIKRYNHFIKIYERRNVMGRGEDTTTYGDATPWLQPGTPLGDLLIEITTGRPPKKKSDEEDSEDDKD